MRNKLYVKRLEICLNKEQDKFVRKIAEENGQRINETIRMMIDFYKENS